MKDWCQNFNKNVKIISFFRIFKNQFLNKKIKMIKIKIRTIKIKTNKISHSLWQYNSSHALPLWICKRYKVKHKKKIIQEKESPHLPILNHKEILILLLKNKKEITFIRIIQRENNFKFLNTIIMQKAC